MNSIRQIEPRFVERVWGRTDLAPLFGRQNKPIGEVWFPVGDDFPLLVKFIFTSARLSVQVHPADAYARQHENSRGKTEMWHILFAEPGATVALGFRENITPERLRSGIADGSVEQMLDWKPVSAGDTIFTPAGVVHAIGGGIVMCEIQQNSDITYRLFDYGRPRELHVEKGLAVCETGPYEGRRPFPVACEHFRAELIDVSGPGRSELECEHLLIAVEGHGSLHGEPFAPGDVWHIPANSGSVALDGSARLIRAS